MPQASELSGQYTDAETGFQYLRARYYDPGTGQFISRDPLVAITGSPYGYVGGNPLNATDPLGLISLRGALGAVKNVTQVVAVVAGVVAVSAAAFPGGQVVSGAALVVGRTAGALNTAATCTEWALAQGSRGDCITSVLVDTATAGVGRLVMPGTVKQGGRILSATEKRIQAGIDLAGCSEFGQDRAPGRAGWPGRVGG